jgi:ribonuclease T2
MKPLRIASIAFGCIALLAAQFHLPGTGGGNGDATPAPKPAPAPVPAPPAPVPKDPGQPAPAPAAPVKAAPTKAVPVKGPFDYYALSLSWAPDFCSLPGNAAAQPKECAGGRGIRFVVHGLRPLAAEGASPESCDSAKKPSRGAISIVQPLMPDESRIRREWAEHGSCTGLSPADYFTDIRHGRSLVQIPVQFTSLDDTATETAQQIEAQFAGANPGFPEGAFRAACAGALLTEVRVCFDPLMKPRACAATVAECPAGELTVRAPR